MTVPDIEFDIRQASAQALAYVRKESLDIYNRLHSIHEDVQFVQQVHSAYPKLPILRESIVLHAFYVLTSDVANLRCGAWYVDPEIVRIQARCRLDKAAYPDTFI